MLLRIAAPLLAAIAGAVVLLLPGGVTDERDAPVRPVQIAPAQSSVGERVAAPTGPVLLEVRGTGDPVRFDRAGLARLAQVRLTTYEPFRKETMTFTGVLLADVLRAAGLRAGGSLYLHALDDYHVTLPVQAIVASGAVLATGAQDGPIRVDSGGPIRVVFPRSTKLGENADNWIWSVDWIRAGR